MLASTSRADLLAQRGCRCGTPGGSVRSSTQTRSSKNFTTKLPLTTTLGTGLARTGTNTGTPKGKKHFGGNQGLIDKKESTLQKETQGREKRKKVNGNPREGWEDVKRDPDRDGNRVSPVFSLPDCDAPGAPVFTLLPRIRWLLTGER